MSLERTHIDFTAVAAAVTVVESSLEPTYNHRHFFGQLFYTCPSPTKQNYKISIFMFHNCYNKIEKKN